jgi:hypothetical protein
MKNIEVSLEQFNDTPLEKIDNVNHPKRYKGQCSLECINVMELAMGKEAVISFCLGNAFKYVWRCDFKNGKEDIDKAIWYLNYATELLGDFEEDVQYFTRIGEEICSLYKTIKLKEKEYKIDRY